MKIGFMVNDIATEEAGYSTTRMAVAAINRGHEAWLLSAGDFAYDPDEKIRGRAIHAPKSKYTSGTAYLNDLRSSKARADRITIDDLDHVVPHQANDRIITNLMKQLSLPASKVFSNIKTLGNTGSASTGICLSQNINKIDDDSIVGITVFGGGYSAGAMVIRF